MLLGRGEFERARDAVAYLAESDERARTRYEVTPAGVTLTEEHSPSRGWGRYLSQRMQDLERARDATKVHDEELLGRRIAPSAPFTPGMFGPLAPFVEPAPLGQQQPEVRFFGPPGGPGAVPPRPEPPLMPRFQRPDAPR
jgi:hypothetical protein